MGIVLFRVDERLIHGQVVIGWGIQLRPDRYVVVDDALAVSEWEQELYHLSVTSDVSLVFAAIEDARQQVPQWQADAMRTVVLTRDVATMWRLARDKLLEGESVNLGGIHHREGRRQVRPYLYLDDSDREAIRGLGDEGVTVTARDLPGSVGVGAQSLLEER